MPVFTKERTARKAYKCQRCLGLIRPGERYRAYSIPPGSDLDNDGWISGREHLDVNCVLYQDEPPVPEDWQGLPLKEGSGNAQGQLPAGDQVRRTGLPGDRHLPPLDAG